MRERLRRFMLNLKPEGLRVSSSMDLQKLDLMGGLSTLVQEAGYNYPKIIIKSSFTLLLTSTSFQYNFLFIYMPSVVSPNCTVMHH